jgi:NAD(P)-dependent dehydrogenase (short-subunit alcohol dehydrogenase family)
MTSTAESAKFAGTGLFDLTGKRAVVTGASRGIGRAITVGLAEHGAEVIAVARTVTGLDETVAAAAGAPGKVHALAADLSNADTIDSAITTAVDTLGGLDILVNNAATDHDSPIEETDLATFQRVIELNLQSCWLLAKAASPHLSADGGGKLINVASTLGLVAMRDDSAYIAAKHGLVGVTKALAIEWGRRNVQVNALAPGMVETEMTRDGLAIEAVAKWAIRNTPLGRWAQPEEMVGAAVFLASPASDFVTGHVLLVDGGWTAQ